MTPKKQISIDSLKLKLEYYCSYQERCIYDVKKKMDVYDLDESERNEIIAHLKSHQFLDENRFVALFIKSKVSSVCRTTMI